MGNVQPIPSCRTSWSRPRGPVNVSACTEAGYFWNGDATCIFTHNVRSGTLMKHSNGSQRCPYLCGNRSGGDSAALDVPAVGIPWPPTGCPESIMNLTADDTPFVLDVRRGLPSGSATELNRKGLIH